MLATKVEANAKFNFFKLLSGLSKIPDKFLNSDFQFPFYSGFLD